MSRASVIIVLLVMAGPWRLLATLALVTMLVTALVTKPVSAIREAAVWIDDGNGHTVKEPLGPRESREFSLSLRKTMGLPEHPPPRAGISNRDASAPTFMRTIYNTLDELGLPRDSNLDPAHKEALGMADTVVTFTSKAPPAPAYSSAAPHAPHRLLFFDTTEVSMDHTLLGAELRIHYQPRIPEYMDNHLKKLMLRSKILHVYLVLNANGGEMMVAQTQLLREGWVTLNVTAPTLAWILQPQENRGFRLAVTEEDHKHEHNLHSVGLSTSHDREEHRPILVAYFTLPEGVSAKPTVVSVKEYKTNSMLLSRSVRSLPPIPSHHNFLPAPRSTTTCQMRPLHVSFEDLNWQHWVIAPDGYDANFCDGHCNFPMQGDMNATNHALVQNMITVLAAVKDGDRVPPKVCCTPKDLATISVLYYDYSSNVVLKKYPKMIVKNCACR